MPRIALFPGSFDPVTNGHVDLVRQSLRLADRLVLAIGTHPGKAPLFSAEDRLVMLEAACGPLARAAGCELRCITFADLVVAAARREGASLLIRGLRGTADFDYEMEMAGMNASDGGRRADGVPAGLAGGAPDHRHTGQADRIHGRRRDGFCAAAGGGAAEGKIRRLKHF